MANPDMPRPEPRELTRDEKLQRAVDKHIQNQGEIKPGEKVDLLVIDGKLYSVFKLRAGEEAGDGERGVPGYRVVWENIY